MSALAGGTGVPLTPQGAPLTPEEQQTIARLFSDPFYFPLQFKTWLQWFIENVQGEVAGGGIGGGGGSGGTGLNIPVGGIVLFSAGALPAGFFWCNGVAYSRVTYNTLYQVIGTTFGAGDGSTTFNVPDLDGRMVVGWAQSGGHADVAALGASEGIAKSSRRPKHKHTVNDPQHTHQISVGGSGGGTPNRAQGTTTGEFGQAATYGAYTGVTIGPQSGAEPTDTPAYLALPALIRYI